MKTRMIVIVAAVVLMACNDVTGPTTDEISNPGPGLVGGIPMQSLAAAGDGQTGRVASMLPDWIVVQVKDAKNQPVADWPVAFSIVDNSGSVVRDTASQGPITFEKRVIGNAQALTIVTDDAGFARVRWILGYAVGENHLIAQVQTRDGRQPLGDVIKFSAFATAD